MTLCISLVECPASASASKALVHVLLYMRSTCNVNFTVSTIKAEAKGIAAPVLEARESISVVLYWVESPNLQDLYSLDESPG